MSPFTNDYDIELQVGEEAIERILKAIHAAGVMQHHYARVHNQKRVELHINSLRISFVPGVGPRALATSRVYYHSRNLSDAGDPGSGAVADVIVRTRLRPSTFTSDSPWPPYRLAADTTLIVDWRETTREDITVLGAPAELENEVKDALLDFIREEDGGAFPIPPIGVGGAQIGRLDFRFLPPPPAPGLRPALIIGMNFGDVSKGSLAGAQEWFLAQDWALGVSGTFVIDQLLAKMRQSLGHLPPPHGTEYVYLSETVRLTHFDPFLAQDRLKYTIVLEWKWKPEDSGWGKIGSTDPSHALEFSLTIGPAGELQIDDDPWTGQWAQLWTALNDALRGALPLAAQAGQGGIFTSLRSFASLGTGADIVINPRATNVQIRPTGIIVQGTFVVERTSSPPVAELEVLPSSSSPFRRILYGGWSWAPGGQISKYQWDFGDGQSEVTEGTSARFMAEHSYSPGEYNPCLTVTDDQGRTAKNGRSLRIDLFNAATYESRSVVPPSMVGGQRLEALVTMRNNGTTTWAASGTNPHKLGAQNPRDNETWGAGRVHLQSDVPPGASATFNFTVTAPSDPGRYDFQWRMLQEGVEWFGDSTPNVSVNVTQSIPADTTPPTITDLRPAPDSSTKNRKPTIAATVRDERTDLADADISLFVDNESVTLFSYEQATNRLRYVPEVNLRVGKHTVKIVALDDSGFSKVKTWSFRIKRR